jgi:hypothetical protein
MSSETDQVTVEPSDDDHHKSRTRPLVIAAIFFLAETLIIRSYGYALGGNVVVRCRDDHLFTTIWIPGASVKSLRLGWARYQYCPVGRHWSLVKPVRISELTEDERCFADEHRDVRIP